MSSKLISRLDKIENTLQPNKQNHPCIIITYARNGVGDEVIREETDDEAIKKHLAKHPEDQGRAFEIITIVWFAKHKESEGENAN
jgi:hypothetical protein